MLFLVRNFETLMRLVVIWGTWSTFYKWKFLKVDGRIFESVYRIEIFLPFPIVTWSVPWYGWTSERVLTSWLRWWVTPVLKNHASLFSRVEDANMACMCMLLLLLGLLFVGRLSVVTLDHGVVIFLTQSALKTVSWVVVASLNTVTNCRRRSSWSLWITVFILRKISSSIDSFVIFILLMSSCHNCRNEISFRWYCILEV